MYSKRNSAFGLQSFFNKSTYLSQYLIFIFQYAPQVWLNYRRKCTEGFHIGGVLLDFSGGVLSLLQQDIYCVIDQSTKQLTGNIPKMALAVVTLVFNVVLVVQHYVLYMGNIPLDALDENKPLLCESSHSNKYCSINQDFSDEPLFHDNDGNESIVLTTSRESLA